MPPFVLSSQNVFDYLIAQGLCTQEEKSSSQIELKPAKNFNLLLNLPNNRKLLVKQERYNREGKTAGEFLQEWRVHDLLHRFTKLSPIRHYFSEAVNFDNDHSIIVFNYLNDYRDLTDFYIKETFFPHEIATAIGITLSSIHRLTIDCQDYQNFFQNAENGFEQQTPNLARSLERITPAIFGAVPSDGLKFFTLYQRYDSLGKAIADLNNIFTPCCLTHNDLKLNNILLSLSWEAAIYEDYPLEESIIRFIDWERCAWGDPANDLGTVIASYLQIWLNSMITSKSMAIEQSLRLATTPLQLLQPSMTALVNAYLINFPEILEQRPDFLQRVMQFCGLALIRAIQATLQHEKTFGNAGICMLQVAKSLLCRPEESILSIFGVEISDLMPATLSLA
ncbi:MAG: phosphotransferase [Desmonostoc vinosum HA7617-LM4]|jgi:hypothetical protein|nr:phosphotransferase [Desmonostoc vinosum HA7617-LM4]